MIEELSDIIEEISDVAGVYGAHDEKCSDAHPCRVCFTSNLEERIDRAYQFKNLLRENAHAIRKAEDLIGRQAGEAA